MKLTNRYATLVSLLADALHDGPETFRNLVEDLREELNASEPDDDARAVANMLDQIETAVKASQGDLTAVIETLSRSDDGRAQEAARIIGWAKA
ncbi:MAG: hypothetical protein OXT09_15815 [Myxococcales bacterium]|nr:hypothetical protein [Myxococcales bacterium]